MFRKACSEKLVQKRSIRNAGNLKPKTRNPKLATSPSRAAAFDILLRVERESSYASELLHSVAYERLSISDHALTTELVMGVLRWRSRLDAEIAEVSSQPLRRLDLEVLIALRIGVYQLRWLDRIPVRAAIHESVELVKRALKRSAAPFVNALLRRLSESVHQPPLKPPGREDLSNEDLSNEDLNAEDLRVEDLAREFAHPLWLVERWTKQYGLASTIKICEYDQTVPVTAIRLSRSAAEGELRDSGVKLGPGKLLASATRIRSGDITKTQAFARGEIVIQDEASQLVAALVGNGKQILDCCAAPGGKTLAIAGRNPRAQIIAADLHPHRARLLYRLTHGDNTHASNTRVIAADARDLPFSNKFDRVLADVPCSGTGTLAHNPEIKWRVTPEDLADLHARQLAILRSALTSVAAGGRVIYSTCSLEKEENENVVERALAEDKSFAVIACRVELERLKLEGESVWSDTASLASGPYLRTLPGVHPCDGFFAAILEKI